MMRQHNCEHEYYSHKCPCLIEGSHTDSAYYAQYPYALRHGMLAVFLDENTGEWTDGVGKPDIDQAMVQS